LPSKICHPFFDPCLGKRIRRGLTLTRYHD
jgi:hypothetical protein